MQIKITKHFRWPIRFVSEDGTDVEVTGVFREPTIDQVEDISAKAKDGTLKQADLVRANLVAVEGVDFVDADGRPMSAADVRDLFCSHTRYVIASGIAYMEGLSGYRGKPSEKSREPSPDRSEPSTPASATS